MSRSCPDGSNISNITSSRRAGSCTGRRLRLSGSNAARRSTSFIGGCISGGGERSRRWLSCQSASNSRGSASRPSVCEVADYSSSSSSSSTSDITSSRSRRQVLFAAAHNRCGNNLQDAKELTSAFMNQETDSELIHSGHQEGCIGMDLDAVKSAISRMSIYEEAFFKEGLEQDRYYLEELGLRQSYFKLAPHEAAEVHLSLDQADGSEMVATLQAAADGSDDQATMRWRVVTWLGYQRRWLASLGHAGAGTECERCTELSFDGADQAGQQLRLRLCFHPEGGGATSEDAETAAAGGGGGGAGVTAALVLRLGRLAHGLRRLLLSSKRRQPGGARHGNFSS